MARDGEWGYASCDVDDEDGCEHLTYTRYRDGHVDRYTDNGDGGHSHSHWDSEDDYNAGEDPDYYRAESSKHGNPSIENIQNDSGCYLTTACMQSMRDDFDDKCYELETLRWFRDKYVSKEDKLHYYEVAPVIVSEINKLPQREFVYKYIYKNLIQNCVKFIEQGEYEFAYSGYKNSVQTFEKKFVKDSNENEEIKPLKIETEQEMIR